MAIVARSPENIGRLGPADPELFTDPDEPRRPKPKPSPRPKHLWREEHEAWASYCRHFMDHLDPRGYDLKEGHVGRWFLAKFRKDGPPIYLKNKKGIKDKQLLERHLDAAYWAERCRARGRQVSPNPQWLGAYAGPAVNNSFVDLDNHGQKITYRDAGGVVRQVASDLTVEFLCRVGRVLGIVPGRTIVTTSSASLGIYVWFKWNNPTWTREAYDRLRLRLAGIGLPKAEVYPMPPSQDRDAAVTTGRRCNRLPFGEGMVTITPTCVHRTWVDQVRHFDEPEPAPSIERVARCLLDLWREQIAGWADRPQELLVLYQERHDEIEAWIAEGCPDRLPETGKDDEEPRRLVARKAAPVRAPTTQESLDHEEKYDVDYLYRLATLGLTREKELTRALFVLSRHLVCLELHGRSDRRELACRSLEIWCIARHNGLSSRLEVGDTDVNGKLSCDIARFVRDAEKHVDRDYFGSLRWKNYRFPLRLRWLIAGEGERNLYSGRRGGGSSYTNTTTHREEFSVSDLAETAGDDELPDWIRDLAQADNRDARWLEAVLAKIETIDLTAPLPKAAEALLKTGFRRAKAIEVNRRLLNWLIVCGGKARIHTDVFPALLGTNSMDTIARWKDKLIKLGLVEVTGKHRAGKESKEYRLGEAFVIDDEDPRPGSPGPS